MMMSEIGEIKEDRVRNRNRMAEGNVGKGDMGQGRGMGKGNMRMVRNMRIGNMRMGE